MLYHGTLSKKKSFPHNMPLDGPGTLVMGPTLRFGLRLANRDGLKATANSDVYDRSNFIKSEVAVCKKMLGKLEVCNDACNLSFYQ